MKNILNFMVLCLLLLCGLPDATCSPIKQGLCATNTTFVSFEIVQPISFLTIETPSVTIPFATSHSSKNEQGNVALNFGTFKGAETPSPLFSRTTTTHVANLKVIGIKGFSNFPYLPHNYPSGTKGSAIFLFKWVQSDCGWQLN